MGKSIQKSKTSTKMAARKLTFRQLSLLQRCGGPGGVAKASLMTPTFVQSRSMAGDPQDPAPWNYLWMPGPYPKTEEEMCAAAKKYCMIREDYVPHPDDGNGTGDYPDLGRCSGRKRPRLAWWDDEDFKRNFGTPMQYDWFMTCEAGWDSECWRSRDTPQKSLCIFLAYAFGITGFCLFLNYFGADMIQIPTIDEQNPWFVENKDKKFYTFEKPE